MQETRNKMPAASVYLLENLHFPQFFVADPVPGCIIIGRRREEKMLLRKGCLALGGIGFLLISGCLWLLSSVGEAEHIAEAPVEYCTLSPSEQEMIPPFAEKIYSAVYADWQIGEWCYCFEIQRGNEKALKNWCKEVCAGRDAIQPSVRPYHLTTPSWWEIPSGASLLCAVAGDLQHPMSFSAWYDAAQNKVWLMYHR